MLIRSYNEDQGIDFRGHSTMLVLLAHQDDEFGFAPVISRAIKAKIHVVVACLTSGSLGKEPDSTRDDELIASLKVLGVTSSNYWPIGSVERFPDSKLIENLDAVLAILEARILFLGLNVTALATHAWEGGHQDHDACNLVARKLLKRNLTACKLAMSFPMYHCENTIKPFFRAFKPVSSAIVHRVLKLTLFERMQILGLPIKYPSQVVSLMGLYPFAFLEFGVFGRLHVLALETSFHIVRPHLGALFYERRKKFSYREFEYLAKIFLKERQA